MSFFSSPAFGQIAGGVIGGLFGNKAAKYQRGNDAAAIAAQMAPFNLVSPYLSDLYSGSKDALNKALGIGAYTGDTYAGMNPLADEGYSAIAGLGRNFTTGSNSWTQLVVWSEPSRHLQPCFRPNPRRCSRLRLFQPTSRRDGRRSNADSTRRLNEQTLPGIGLAASGTGNANNTRRFMNEAIAQAGMTTAALT